MQAEQNTVSDDDTPAESETAGGIVSPSRTDGFVGGVSELIGGRLGEHTAPYRRSVRFVGLFVLTMVIVAMFPGLATWLPRIL